MNDPQLPSSIDIRTPEGFAAALCEMKPLQFAEAVSELTEAERKKLSKTAQELFRVQREMHGRSEIERMIQRRLGLLDRAGLMCCLGLLAAAPRSAAVRPMRLASTPMSFGRFDGSYCDEEKAAIRILLDRRPEWATDWLNAQLAADNFPTIQWQSVRTLIKSGVCQRPVTVDYVRQFAFFGYKEDLASQPDLMDDLWLVFQVDARAFDQWNEKTTESLPSKMIALLNEGKLDRTRLLSEILKGLWQDWQPASLSGLARFHDHLNFSQDERNQRLRDYAAHLANPVSTIVAWGIRNLKELVSQPDFDPAIVFESLQHVFNIAAKAQPALALGMMKAIAKHDRQTIPLMSVSLSRALTHQNADVQDAALSLIEGWQNEQSRLNAKSKTQEADPLIPLLSMIGSIADQISPTLRIRINALVAPTQQAVASKTDDHEAKAQNAQESATSICDELARQHNERIDALPESLSSPLCLRESLAAALDGRMLPTCCINDLHRVLPFVEQVQPIVDVEELLDAIAAALEKISSPMQIERILDGISRFGMDYPEGFRERSVPILQRLKPNGQFTFDDSLRSTFVELMPLSTLLFFWLSSGQQTISQHEINIPSAPAASTSNRRRMLCHRASVIYSRFRSGQRTGSLLSLPTHEHGWIDPREFVRRLDDRLRSDVEMCQVDFTVGLMRLAPDFCEQALQQAQCLTDEIGRIVRYALGADAELSEASSQWRAEWLAAGRSRSPWEDLTELSELDLPTGPNAITGGTIRLKLEEAHFPESSLHRSQQPLQDVMPVTPPSVPEATGTLGARLISLGLTEDIYVDGYKFIGWDDTWQASYWPARPDLTIAKAIPRLIARLDQPPSSFEPFAPFLNPLLYSEQSWPEISLQAIGLGLASRDTTARAIAADALVEGILDGRADPITLGEILSEFANHPRIKLNRLTDAWKEASAVSLWAALTVATVLECAVCKWDAMPREGHLVLGLLLEVLFRLRIDPSPAVRPLLTSLSGKNKAASIASRLLALHFQPGESLIRQALLEGVQARIERAERVIRYVSNPEEALSSVRDSKRETTRS